MLDKKTYDMDNALECLSSERAKMVFRQLAKIYSDMSIFWDAVREEAILEEENVTIIISGNF